MTIIRCPHCGGKSKIIKIGESAPSGGWFDSAAPSLRWVLFGNGRRRPQPGADVIHVKADLRTGDTQYKFNGLDLPVSKRKLFRLAPVYVRGDKWTRKGNVAAGLSQTDHHKLKEALIGLGFLDRINARDYRLNVAGRLMFRQIART